MKRHRSLRAMEVCINIEKKEVYHLTLYVSMEKGALPLVELQVSE